MLGLLVKFEVAGFSLFPKYLFFYFYLLHGGSLTLTQPNLKLPIICICVNMKKPTCSNSNHDPNV